jgi:ribosomal protein S18 acetylase RimI-like enzyme
MGLIAAYTPEHLDTVRWLFQEYADEIGVDLCFQGFAQELAELPGQYAPPAGRLLLGQCEGQLVGCVGLRPFEERPRVDAALTGSPNVCEMKRLYVRPEFRGRGVGRALAVAVIAAAREIGYDLLRLDTLAHMRVAIALYRSLRFTDTTPYRHNPLPGATYLELDLRETGTGGSVLRCDGPDRE